MKQGVVILSIVLGALWLSSFSKDKPTEASLGKTLFFDPILSEDRSISCASCHKPQFAFADTGRFSLGVRGQVGIRNTPSAMNVTGRPALFWDGRAATLEDQALVPIANPIEMNLPVATAVARLNASAQYRALFNQVYHTTPTAKNLGAALAAFERTLETGHTPNDRWMNDEPNGLTEQQVRGRDIFRTKGKCFDCHFSPDFTGDEFRSIGLFNGKDLNDSGRFMATHNPADINKMKVPGLRNVAVTAPYMHNGQFKTLAEVIEYYDNPNLLMPDGMFRDSLLLQPLGLTVQEKLDLEAFLNGLTDDQFVKRP
ncbi:MAG: cytochrome-c peroxidase [Sphingobacteriales bacterium]|nr:MAG: cytochrome-c peroxidase [Sphingobacteriales bacterium]